jgi:IclR family acetate operon transcriptional repressor
MRLPAHCTALGKCLLAQLPNDVARAALGKEPYERRTQRTITTWASLAADLAAIRDAGVSVSEEEYEVGLVSFAVPLRWLHGPGTAAINVSLPVSRAGAEFRERLIERLRQGAAEIGVPSDGR